MRVVETAAAIAMLFDSDNSEKYLDPFGAKKPSSDEVNVRENPIAAKILKMRLG